MPDIVFKCEACGKHLVADSAGAGITINCPDCNASITIPAAAPSSAAAASIFRVTPDSGPAPKFPKFVFKTTQRTESESPNYEGGPACPDCGANLPPGAILCGNCGLDFSTSKKFESDTSTTGNERETSQCPQCGTRWPGRVLVCSRCGYDRLTGENAFETCFAEQAKRKSDQEESSKVLKPGALSGVIGFLIIYGLIFAWNWRDEHPGGAQSAQTQQATPTPLRNPAYERGLERGCAYGKSDRDLNTYNNFNPDFAGQVRIAYGYQPGTPEFGDFWMGYKDGYVQTRLAR